MKSEDQVSLFPSEAPPKKKRYTRKLRPSYENHASISGPCVRCGRSEPFTYYSYRKHPSGKGWLYLCCACFDFVTSPPPVPLSSWTEDPEWLSLKR